MDEQKSKEALNYLAYLLADQMGYSIKRSDVYREGSVKSA